jgi:long-chain fatty acid transport protein
MKSRIVCLTLGLMVLMIVLSGIARAGGMIMYENNSPSTGTASAGWAALAADASTAFTNPAGMALLDRSQILVGVQPLIISADFNPGAGTSVGGGGTDGGNAGGILPSAGGYFVYNASDQIKLGISSLSYFGLGIDYGDAWVGRYRVEKSTFLTASLVPAVSYRINDWLSAGVMINMMLAYLKTQTAINNLVGPDGQMKYSNTTFGVGGGVGLMFEPTQSTRIGLTYYSPVPLEFTSVPSFEDLGPIGQKVLTGRDLSMTYTVPQWIMLSGYQQVTDKLALMANFGWQDWSQFGKVDLALSIDPATGGLTANMNMQDTWHAAIGAQYRIAPPWLLSVGFAYDSSPYTEENRSPALPLDENFRYAAGVQYDWSKKLTLGLAYEFIYAGSGSLNRTNSPNYLGTLQGDYSPYNINVVNLNLIYRF